MNRIALSAFLIPLVFALSLLVWKRSDIASSAAPAFLLPMTGNEVAPAQVRTADPITLIGVASVIDGDTIEVHGNRIRLNGIDAPESSQTCLSAGETYRCGQQAALFLDGMIVGRQVNCKPLSKDRYGRTIAICELDGRDLGAAMVAAGWALAYRQYDMAYVPQESEASKAGHGMWAGAFVEPWLWRSGRRLEGQ